MRSNPLITVADAIVAVVLAPACAACGRPLEAPLSGPVCAACWTDIRPITPPVCDACGGPLPTWRVHSLDQARCARCRRFPTAVDRARAIGSYDGALRAIVHALKYHGRRTIASTLAARLREAGATILDGADAVVPVPLHRRRQRTRGFNQAHELARHLGPPVCHALTRRRHTRPQVDLPAAQRHRNVREAFALARPWWACGKPTARGLDAGVVVLVDDVSTTGATLNECARVLKAAGVREVRALTAARAVRDRVSREDVSPPGTSSRAPESEA